jgi:hypothetical protein
MRRFSLRTLLILVFIACCGFAFCATTINRATHQREFIERIKTIGSVEYDCFYEDGKPFGDASPEKQWEKGIFSGMFYEIPPDMIYLGPAYPVDFPFPPRQEDLVVRIVKEPDAILRDIALFPKLRILVLRQSKINNASLSFLKPLQRLEYLDIGDTDIDDEGMNILEGLTALTYVNVKNTHVTARGIERLKNRIPSAVVNQ